MDININQFVKVKLTTNAILVLESRHLRLYPGEQFILPEVDKDGYSKFQLWTLMQIFGEQMLMGRPQMFVDGIISVTEQ